jgi:uncharacterized protein
MTMGLMTDEELARLAPAESSLFASPIPVQSVSSDEYMPAPQTEKQREFEARVKAIRRGAGAHQGMSRRAFFKTSAGMAAAFVAMNETFGPLYMVSRAEAATPEMANERARRAQGPVHHGHAHPFPARRHAPRDLRAQRARRSAARAGTRRSPASRRPSRT